MELKENILHISPTEVYLNKIKTATYRTVEEYNKDKSKNPKTYIDLSLGAFFQAFKERESTVDALKSFRKFYPDAPVYLVSDKGFDFSGIAKEFKCRYVYSNYQTNIHRMGTLWSRISWLRVWRLKKAVESLAAKMKIPLWKPDSIYLFLNRLKEACLYCNTEWMLLLEDDVRIRDRISKYPDAHIAGVSAGNMDRDGRCLNTFSHAARSFILNKYPDIELNGAGGCGGSIFHVPSFLKCMQNIKEFDVGLFHELDPCIGEAPDFTLVYLFLFNGFIFRVWLDLSEKDRGEAGLGDAAAVEHQVRDLYRSGLRGKKS